MRDETDKEHRNNITLGLLHLTEFLNNRYTKAPLNLASREEVHYSILEKDSEAARQEFNAWSKYLRECDGSYWGAVFYEEHRPHEETTQHIAELQFADNHVAYRVVWIERAAQTEPEPKEHLCPTCGERYDDCDSISEHAWGSQ